MLRWVPYAFIRIAFFFALGILSAVYFGLYLSQTHALWLVSGATAFFLISKLLLQKQHFFSLGWVQGIAAFTAIFFLGYLNLNLNNQRLDEKHLLHLGEINYYQGVINRPAEEKANTYKYEFEVGSVKSDSVWVGAKAKIYLYVKKGNGLLAYGDKLLIKGNPDEISPPMNPGEFDYKRFLTFKNVYHQDYLTNNYEVVGNEQPSVILARGFEVRKKASAILARYISTNQENNIAQALILGVKDGLDRDIENAYAASGAMHVLAVSGLHVGIIYGIVLLLFKPFRKTRLRNWLLAIISLFVLWSYALITGFSPSVLRAVTMFSFIAVAQASGRNTNIYNTLAASGFILLLFNPYLIMSVGFQLSFLAVFGIVYIQPRLYNAWEVDNYWLDQIWAITAVSIAAQIATIPLTLLYFHQFPTFFLVSNLVVIPGAFLILCVGLVLLFISPIAGLAKIVGWVLQKVIFVVNYVVFQISEIPYSQITDIEITTFQSWLIIAGTVCVLLLFDLKKFKYLLYVFVIGTGFSAIEFSQTLNAKDQQKLIIYRVNNHTTIDFITGVESSLYTDSVFRKDAEGLRFHTRPNRLYSGIVNHTFIDDNQPNIQSVRGMKLISWNHLNLLILGEVDKKDFSLVKPMSFDYLILAKGFNKDIKWINDNFEYKQIVLDGSLKWYKANSFKSSLDSLKTDYYSVYHEGALEINIKN